MPVRRRRTYPTRGPSYAVLAIGYVALMVACGKDHTGPLPTGDIALTVTTPAGVAGALVVSGPKAFSQAVTASQVLTGVPTGVYTITADSAVIADSVVGSLLYMGAVSQPSVTVDANDTARSGATYTLKVRRGVLWVSNDEGTSLRAFGADSLRPPGGSTPLDTISGGLDEPDGMAFDPSGNLWIANEGTADVMMFTAAQLAAGGALTPTQTLSSASFSFVLGLRFDPKGNMWVVDGNELLEFTPAQLSAGGTQTPAVTISGNLLHEAIDMVFDSAGDAWVSDFQANVLMRFSAAQLATTGTPVPVDTITATGGSLANPAGLAMDKSGNLWVANYPGTIVEFSPSQLSAGGSPTPLITLAPAGANSVWGMAFDHEGGLWAANWNTGTVFALSATQLASSGSPTPDVTITSLDAPAYVLFDPITPMVPGAGHAVRVRGSVARTSSVRGTRVRGSGHSGVR